MLYHVLFHFLKIIDFYIGFNITLLFSSYVYLIFLFHIPPVISSHHYLLTTSPRPSPSPTSLVPQFLTANNLLGLYY